MKNPLKVRFVNAQKMAGIILSATSAANGIKKSFFAKGIKTKMRTVIAMIVKL